jgi:probable rRNA maturation factor
MKGGRLLVEVFGVSRCRAGVTRADVARAVRAVARERPGRLRRVSVAFVGSRTMARLHRQFLGRPGPTDVMAFPLAAPGGGVVGDIYVCPDVACANARRFGVPAREECLRLVVHGTLHVLGFDHPGDARATGRARFFRRQERILARVVGSGRARGRRRV